MDNDGAHKFAFHLVEMLRDLLRLVVPWTDELDFDNAREIPAAHVEASGDGFKQRYGDGAPWRARWQFALQTAGGTRMTTIAQERLGKWFENFRATNLAQGIEQGRAMARAEAVARLRRQAAIKFGDATAERWRVCLATRQPARSWTAWARG